MTNITVQDVRSIYGIREILEPYALELAIDNISSEQLTSYLNFYADSSKTEESGREKLDRSFHDLIYNSTNNQYLCTILKMLYDQNTRIRRLSNMKVNNRYKVSGKERLEIIHALLSKNLSDKNVI